MENLRELCSRRYSVRTYLNRPVEKEKIEYILDCARLAPSACNFQPWFFYVVTDEKLKDAVRQSYDREWFKTAPAYIVVCKDIAQSWKRTTSDNKDFGNVDAAIAGEHICIAAAEQNLGTCWVCNFRPNMLEEALSLPQNLDVVAIFPLGYIDEVNVNIPEKKRKSLDEISKWI